MIFFYSGNKSIEKKNAYESVLGQMSKKGISLSVLRMSDLDFNPEKISELLGAQGLFGETYAVIFENVLQEDSAEEYIYAKLKEMKESENIFIFLEANATKERLSKFKKYADEAEDFSDKSSKAFKKEFSVFSLTDSFGARDKKNTWILYTKSKEAGITPEEVHGILFWLVKSMIVVKDMKNDDKSAKDSGLNPFVFRKSLSFSKNFSEKELFSLSSHLVSLIHMARRRSQDSSLSLESFILKSL